MNKRGAMELSFGMIFSIILIIFFIGFAFYVITSFLDLGDDAKIGSFKNSFQEDIDKAWKGYQSSEEEIYNLPKDIEKVCIIDLSEEGESDIYKEIYRFSDSQESNLFFYPFMDLEIKELIIEHIDIKDITDEENPYCFDVEDGKVNIIIKKERNSENNLVDLER